MLVHKFKEKKNLNLRDGKSKGDIVFCFFIKLALLKGLFKIKIYLCMYVDVLFTCI